jgi:hypothetical protein
VPVLKSDKASVRIYGDFRTTVNPVSKLDKYPLPKVEDLFSRLGKGKFFFEDKSPPGILTVAPR